MFNNKKKEDQIELGFGTKDYKRSVRFLNRDGSVNIRRKNAGKRSGFDLYHWLITITWPQLILLILASYIIVNTIFAVLYFIIGADKFGGLSLTSPVDDFLQLFFFSAQTLTTVGYGHIYPNDTMISSIGSH